MKEYDLILVVGYFRSATAYLSVLCALGRTLRIAVLTVEADSSMRAKTGEAEAVFFDLCSEFGADFLTLGEPARAPLLVVQQFAYDDALAAEVQRNLVVRDRVGLMTLAMAGLDRHDAFLRQFGIHKVHVPSRRFMNFLLDRRGAQSRYAEVEIVEVGLPYARYRLFSEFAADWLIAAPTLFSFHSEAGKQQFLDSVLQLLSRIPAEDLVVYKSHNGNVLDYFAPHPHCGIAAWLMPIPGAARLLQLAGRLAWPALRRHLDRIRTCMLHREVMKRAVQMSVVTPYAGMSLEAFLPGVRKGVIGGLSNTIWGSLYFDLPFFNCVDEKLRKDKSELLDKRSDNLLDLNLKYFGVPFCQNDLNTDVRKLDIVQPNERQGDLVAAILDDLARARETHGAEI